MEVGDSLKQLLNAAKELSREEADQLIYLLIDQRMREEREPDGIIEQDNGTVVKFFSVRPDERRSIRKEHYDHFMGLLKYSYQPPAKADYIRQILTRWTGLPAHYFKPSDPPDSVRTLHIRPRSEDEARELINKLAAEKGLSPEEFIHALDDLLYEMSENIFWRLARDYDNAIRQAQSELMLTIESELHECMGIALNVSESQGDHRIDKRVKDGFVERQIKGPAHRRKGKESLNKRTFLIDVEETIFRIAKKERREDLTQIEVAGNLKRYKSSADVMRHRLKLAGVEEKWRTFVKNVLAKRRKTEKKPDT